MTGQLHAGGRTRDDTRAGTCGVIKEIYTKCGDRQTGQTKVRVHTFMNKNENSDFPKVMKF